MPVSPQDLYNPTPLVTPEIASPQNQLEVRATPDAFGAQVGQSLQRAGATGEQAANEGSQLVLQQQGILNEASASDAEVQLSQIHGELAGKYRSLQGFDAVNARDSYMQKVIQAREQIGSLLNPAARAAYNTMTARTTGYVLRDMGDYAASQVKVADNKSALASIEMSVNSGASIGDNDVKFGEAKGNIEYQASKWVANQGFADYLYTGTDGHVHVDTSTPQGIKAKQVWDATLQKFDGDLWTKNILGIAYSTQPGQGIAAAMVRLNSHEKDIPPATFSTLTRMLKPKYRLYQANNIVNNQMANLDEQYTNYLGGKVEGPTTPNTVLPLFTAQETSGGVTDPDNINQIQPSTWTEYAKPGENIRNPKDNNAVAQRVLNHLWDVASKVSGGNEIQTLERVAVGYFSGANNIAPAGSSIPWIHNSVDKNNKSVSSYVSDIVSRYASMQKTGGYLPKVDFLRTKYAEFVNSAREAGSKLDTDPAVAESAAQLASSRLNTEIRGQVDAIHAQGTQFLQRILGEDGQPPITNINELEGPTANPELAEKWGEYKLNNPLGAETLERYVYNQSRGQASTLGTNFFPLYLQAAEGHITNMSQLGPYLQGLGKNPNDAPLTNTGFGQLVNMINNRTPQQDAFYKQESAFFQKLHDEATGASLHPGIQIPELEQKFTLGMQLMLPVIAAKMKEGMTAAQLFSPTINGQPNKDYVGNMMPMPDPRTVSRLYSGYVLAHAASLQGTVYKSADDIKQAFLSGKFGPVNSVNAQNTAKKLLIESGFAKAASTTPSNPLEAQNQSGPAVPTPPLE